MTDAREFSAQRAAHIADGSTVFPLPLVPFERYMVLDDRSGYPMSFVAIVELRGDPDRTAMEAAVLDAVARHPLLTARLRRAGMKHAWVSGNGEPLTTKWCTAPREADAYLDEPIDLKRSAGVRLAITVQADTTVMRFLFHHALCDGMGAFRFIGDVLACYGRRTAAAHERPTLLPVDIEALRQRGEFDIRLPAPVTRWQVIRSLIRESWKVLARRPRPLRASGPKRRAAAPSVTRIPVISLPAATEHGYRAAATSLRVTVNDLLLRDMFLTVRQWNESRGRQPARDWLRITVPTNLRYRHESRLPAANVLGYALLSRRAGDCDESSAFLLGLASDMDVTRKWGLGSLFVQAIGIVDRIPGLCWFWTRASGCFSTVVFSNVGNPVRRFRARFPLEAGKARAGNLILERIYGAPPIRPGTRAALAVVSYADALTIALRYDTRWLTPEDAAGLLGMFRRQLERTAAGHVAAPARD